MSDEPEKPHQGEAMAAEELAGKARRSAEQAKERAEEAAVSAAHASKMAEQADVSARSAVRRAEKAEAAENLVAKAMESSLGLTDFVEQSLGEILAGVDRAAAAANARTLTEGLAASGLVSPSRIGTIVGGPGDVALVEFDVAIATERQDRNEKTKEAKGNTSFSIKVFDVAQASAGGAASSERTREQRDAIKSSNRIKFAVPVTFASFGESLG